MSRCLIAVRGLDEGRTHLARLLADALPGPVAHVQGDDLARRWIVRGLADQGQEVETVYRLLRLVVVSFLKDGFSVVVDAPFVTLADGIYELRSRDLQDLTRLARSFGIVSTGIVTLLSGRGAPTRLVEALDADTIEGEVRVVPNLMAGDAQAAREIMARLGMQS
jgi:hypothetical protein